MVCLSRSDTISVTSVTIDNNLILFIVENILLSSIDTFALKILFATYSLLGIKDIPSNANSDWIVRERWVHQSDDTYRTIMISESLSSRCSKLESGFVIFPQTYMGQMKIYADDQLIYTNSLSKTWNITQLMSKPLYSCELFKNTKEVKLEINAYMQFFASVSGYPEISESFPVQYVFYDEIFVISSVVSLFLGIIGAILMAEFSTISEAVIYLFQQIGFFLLVVSHVPGRYFDISLALAHSIVVVGGFLGLIALILNTVEMKMSKFKVLIPTITPILILSYLFYGYKNATHLLVFLLIIASLLSSLFLCVYKIKSLKVKKDYLITSLYILLFILILFDGAGSQIKRDSYLHLSSIALIGTAITFLLVLKGFNSQQIKLLTTSLRLDSELKKIATISSLNNVYKEIIHDIKSPVMSLSFLLSDVDKNKSLISSIGDRVKSILARLEEQNLSRIADWYSGATFLSKIKSIKEEKSVVYHNFNILLQSIDLTEIEVYYDPIDLIVIIEEVFDNSLKYSDGSMIIKIDHDKKTKQLNCIFTNYNKNHKTEIDLIKIGSGFGLINIRKKILEMKGDVEVSYDEKYFSIHLKFKAKKGFK